MVCLKTPSFFSNWVGSNSTFSLLKKNSCCLWLQHIIYERRYWSRGANILETTLDGVVILKRILFCTTNWALLDSLKFWPCAQNPGSGGWEKKTLCSSNGFAQLMAMPLFCNRRLPGEKWLMSGVASDRLQWNATEEFRFFIFYCGLWKWFRLDSNLDFDWIWMVMEGKWWTDQQLRDRVWKSFSTPLLIVLESRLAGKLYDWLEEQRYLEIP